MAFARPTLSTKDESCGALDDKGKKSEDNAGMHKMSPKDTLIINNMSRPLNPQDDETQLENLFKNYGTIKNIEIINGLCDKSARVKFHTESSAARAFEAARNRQIQYDNEHLTVTLISDDCTPADILSDKCLQEIFSYFDTHDRLNIELVSKRWYKNCLPGWRNETVGFLLDDQGARNKVRILYQSGCYLRALYIFGAPDGFCGVFETMRICCKNLQHLDIYCRVQPPTKSQFLELNCVFEQCKNLRRLALRDLTENFDWKILNHLPPEMMEIHLDGGRNEDCNKLEARIDLSKFKSLKALSLICLDFKLNALRGIEELSNLKYLRLDLSNYDATNIEVIQQFKNFEFLAIPNCAINDDVLINVLGNNQELKYLDISGDFNLTERSFSYLPRASHLEELTMRNLSNITDTHLSTLCQLQKLDCSGCPYVKDDGLITLIDSTKKLNALCVFGCPVTTHLIERAKELIEPRGPKTVFRLGVREELIEPYPHLRGYCHPFRTLYLTAYERLDDVLAWRLWYIENP